MAESPNFPVLKEIGVEEHDGDVKFKSGSHTAVSCMRNASGHNYGNSSFIVDFVVVSGCPANFLYISSHNLCYQLLRMNLKWQSASQYCRALDSRAHLLVINSEEEQQLVTRGVEEESSKYDNSIQLQYFEEHMTVYSLFVVCRSNMQTRPVPRLGLFDWPLCHCAVAQPPPPASTNTGALFEKLKCF